MPTVYLLDPIAIRHSDPNLSPTAGAKLHTWVAGTTTNQAAYTDSTGTTPHSNPIVADSAGIFPEIWITASAYDLEARKSDDTTVLWNRLNITAPGGSIDAFENSLLGSAGSLLMGWIQAGIGAITRFVQDKLREELHVKDFGGTFDGTTDDSGAVQKAITACALEGGGVVKFPRGKSVKMGATVYLPSNVRVNLRGCTLIGQGTGVGSAMFESGYLSGSAVVSNVGLANRLINASVYNGTIQNANRAFNLDNFNEGSSLHDIGFSNCSFATYTDTCFYSSYRRLTSRGAAGGITTGAFYFVNFVNAVEIERCTAVDRVVGFQFGGGVYSAKISRCTAETCNTGFKFLGIVNALDCTGNYFEHITATAWDFSESSGTQFFGINIDTNWYNDVENCIIAANFRGRWGRANFRNTGDCNVDFSASTNSAVVEIDRSYTATNISSPGLPAGFTLGQRCIASGDDTIFNSGTGAPEVRSPNYGGKTVPLLRWGNPGDPEAGVIPFCTWAANVVGSPASIIVDTNITTTSFGTTGFHVKVIDDVSTYFVYGRIYGTTVIQDDAMTKTVTAANNGGKLRISISQFNNTSGTVSATGDVRIL